MNSIRLLVLIISTLQLTMMVLSFNSCNVMIRSVARRSKVPALYSSSFKGPRPIHKEFTVEKATQEKKELLDVASWPTWSTQGSEKYKVGIKSPLKVYDTNELSYIISGKMEIIPQETNIPILVQPGDFVTFPDGFACYWYVIEPVKKHWYLY